MIRVVEVGPRDGLQNEPHIVPTATKVEFINFLSQAGVDEIEVSSFVSPKWIPQLADATEVFAGISRRAGLSYSALVPNLTGLERALRCNPDRVAIFTASSESFSQKNVNSSIDGTFERFAPVLQKARSLSLPVRGYISTVFWCPYEGRMPPERTLEVAQRLLDGGCSSVSLGDTVGKATPDEVREVLDHMLPVIGTEFIALHFHDTFGRAAANVAAGYVMGIRQFDASAGGLGGCPYAGPQACGNIATQTLVRTLRQLGAEVRIDLDKLRQAAAVVSPYIARRR